MATVFTRILMGELPSYKIYEDDKVYSFLALDAVNLGHTLLIPKVEVNSWMDVDTDLYLHLHRVSKNIGKAIMNATGCPRIGQIVAGFEVPHYHLHLIPAWSIPDLSFSRAQKKEASEMKEIQIKIVEALSVLNK